MKKKKIAIFTTGWCCEILSEFLTGLQEALLTTQTDLFLFLCYPTYADTEVIRQGELNITALPDLHDFDMMIIFGSGLSFPATVEDLIRRGKEAGIPIVIQGVMRDDVYYIGADNYVAARQLCRHLTEEHAVNDLIFIGGTKDSYDSEQRLQAVRDHLDEIGAPEQLREVVYTEWENIRVTRYIDTFCQEGRKLPGAFICANDGLAMETCISLSRHGFHVPKDTIVTGFDLIEDSRLFYPSIASVDQCFTEVGRECGRLFLDLANGKKRDLSITIPCRFVPGDSCGCSNLHNSDMARRMAGRANFTARAVSNYFNAKLHRIDSTVLSCDSYQTLKAELKRFFAEDHDFEGDSFHILLDPNYGLSIYDNGISLLRHGYSRFMEVLCSAENGRPYPEEQFPSAGLVPGYTEDDANHMYVFLPLHEAGDVFGYLVFRDCMQHVANHALQTYQHRFSLVLDRFRHSLSLNLLNKRLLDLMRKDVLTKVGNRMAYEDMEKLLQSEINTESQELFAIAMFDVNNLKLINDSDGHDAGDAYLIRSCRFICEIFKRSPVYRVGGDEFIAVLTGSDYRRRKSLLQTLQERMSPYSDSLPLPDDYVSVACGLSAFRPGEDRTVQDVLKRADEEMYRNKAAMKSSTSPY
ncbi:MAG: GGDEF domain-containing protein [Lachnospiraceae bacterium]|nr:GGDEF domain-containing protein [Lachnospiraceae bacterium]